MPAMSRRHAITMYFILAGNRTVYILMFRRTAIRTIKAGAFTLMLLK